MATSERVWNQLVKLFWKKKNDREFEGGAPFAEGAAYIDGKFMSVRQARIPIMDWGYRRSDVTYDVVGVWDGSFFRLDDHLRRFRDSMRTELR